MNRFATASSDDINGLKKSMHAKNTQKSTAKTAKILADYVKEKNLVVDFAKQSNAELDDFLANFYAEVRTKDGALYKVSSMENLRHGINRYLNSPPINRKIDIIKVDEFKQGEASKVYRSMIKRMKEEGLGATEHYPVISEGHLRVIYGSQYCDTSTPFGLQSKVQFDIRLYFFRRGGENMHSMRKDTFGVKTDDNGMKYVCRLVDEMTKNHRLILLYCIYIG